MRLTALLRTTNLNRSLLIGYYGGGNYGDELLLEVLSNLLSEHNVKDVTITYREPAKYRQYHHDFGYPRIEMQSKTQLIRAIFKNRNIIIGGGGLWGVDMNFNTFLLSCMLFGSRLLGKKVYLLGVGYYNSTNRLGHIGAWLAGTAAHTIIGRDPETVKNFTAYNSHTYLDSDIAWHVKNLDLAAYQDEVAELETRLQITNKTLCITLRRPQAKHRQHEFIRFTEEINAFIAANQDKPILVALLESEAKSPEEYAEARRWQQTYPNVQLLDFPHNPLALCLLFRKHHNRLALIGPQFHIIMTAYLSGAPFMPLVYDNKVAALLTQLSTPPAEQIALGAVEQTNMQRFADNFFGGR
jgi:polysaccharide pyruvyl transferase WcaK-like protein